MATDGQLRVIIVGAGYVGLTTGVCLAYLGRHVTLVDQNEAIIQKLRRAEPTIPEAGLRELMSEATHNIDFATSLRETSTKADVIIIAVGTPSKLNGDADTSAVERVAAEIGDLLMTDSSVVVVIKSTVPIGSARRVQSIINTRLQQRGVRIPFFVASNPEFLREGAAVNDMLYPDRIVVGADRVEAVNVLRQLYAPILEQSFRPPAVAPRPSDYKLPPFITTSPVSAELIKYAANAFLATKISFINEFAGLAEKVGADIKEVARGIGLDKRIGLRYLEAGVGWGGSCLGKDTRAIIYTASEYGYRMELLQAAVNVNHRQRLCVIDKLHATLKVIRGSTIGILGLAFKPLTSDLRDAPAVDIVRKLLEMGARVRVYDPAALAEFRQAYPELDVEYADNIYDLAVDCDALVLVTEWPQFGSANWGEVGTRMRQRIFIDGRNMLDREEMERAGFTYVGVGR